MLASCDSAGTKKRDSGYGSPDRETTVAVTEFYDSYKDKLPPDNPGTIDGIGKAIFEALNPSVQLDYEKAAVYGAKSPGQFAYRVDEYLSRKAFRSISFGKQDESVPVEGKYAILEAIPKIAGMKWGLLHARNCINYCAELGQKGVHGGVNQLNACFYLYLSHRFSPKTNDEEVIDKFRVKKANAGDGEET